MIDEMEKYGYNYLKHKPKLFKYWKKRHLLFSEFEKGIQLDEGIFDKIVYLYLFLILKFIYKNYT